MTSRPSIQGIKKPCSADENSGEVKLAKLYAKRVREQASSESADEISGEVTACSHCLQPGFFRISQLVDSRVLNPSYIDEDSFLKGRSLPLAVIPQCREPPGAGTSRKSEAANLQLLATNLQLGLSGRRLISQSECLRLRVSQSSESIEDSFLKGETANWQSVHSKLSQIGDRISRKS